MASGSSQKPRTDSVPLKAGSDPKFNPNPNAVASSLARSSQVQPVAATTGLSVSSTLDAGHWMTVIQNRFNGTVIQNMQQLNIELNNLGVMYRLPQGIRGSIPVLP